MCVCVCVCVSVRAWCVCVCERVSSTPQKPAFGHFRHVEGVLAFIVMVYFKAVILACARTLSL